MRRGLERKKWGWRIMCILRPTAPQDMEELAQICDHIIFNSEKQLRTYLPVLKASGTAKAGLRINPECSTQEGHAIYDPLCARLPHGHPRLRFYRRTG